MQDVPVNNRLSVSVVMCTYNGAAFIEDQLNSILNQTYPIKEVLVFDDVSTDATTEIVKRIAQKNPVVSLQVNETNIGFTRNFEQGFLAASGDVIAVADQDDIWLPLKIEKMINAWKPGVPLIYCYSYVFDKEPPISTDTIKQFSLFRWFEGTDARKIFIYNTVSGHAMMFRKSLLDLVLPFSEQATYDWWMAVVACYNGGVQFVPDILVFHRRHNNNATLKLNDKSTKEEKKERLKRIVSRSNIVFANAPNMPEKHKDIALQLSRLLKESLYHKFYKPLFLFLLRYRRPFFNHKKRKIELFTQVKNSYRVTKN